MFVFRVSSALVVMVLLSKSALFVADDSKFLEVESLGAIEKRVSKLIDEAMRHREEEEEREDEANELGFAVRFNAVRKTIDLCVDGVCSWVRSRVRIARDAMFSTSTGFADVVARHISPQPRNDRELELSNKNPAALTAM